MNDLLIKFAHPYKKLDVCDGRARLLYVEEVRLRELSKSFLDYDTEGLYSFPTGKDKYLLMIFQGERGIFTTVRATHAEKTRHFQRAVGEQFEVKVNTPKKKPCNHSTNVDARDCDNCDLGQLPPYN